MFGDYKNVCVRKEGTFSVIVNSTIFLFFGSLFFFTLLGLPYWVALAKGEFIINPGPLYGPVIELLLYLKG